MKLYPGEWINPGPVALAEGSGSRPQSGYVLNRIAFATEPEPEPRDG
jgi:hypothetical protein